MSKKLETTRTCRVQYTDAERLELGKKLAESHNDLAKINADFDSVKTEFKAKISAEEARIVDLSNKVSSGHRMEPVKCKWRMDQPKVGMKELVRLDTNEVIETLEMTEHDKQAELNLPANQAAAAEAANPTPDNGDVPRTTAEAPGVVTVPADKS